MKLHKLDYSKVLFPINSFNQGPPARHRHAYQDPTGLPLGAGWFQIKIKYQPKTKQYNNMVGFHKGQVGWSQIKRSLAVLVLSNYQSRIDVSSVQFRTSIN